MGFNSKAFLKTKFTAREKQVPVEDLQCFFGDDQAVWTVRGLTGEELAKVNEAAANAKNMDAIINGIVSDDKGDIAAAIREKIGMSADLPADLIRRMEMLILGSVEPVVDRELAKKLADAYPIEFNLLTGEIYKLTGMGKNPGKQNGSGKTPDSGPTQPSAMPGDNSSTT